MSYIIDAIRTPIAKQNGYFKAMLPEILASICIKEILSRNRISENQIQDIFLANAFGTGGNMARNASLRAFPNNSIACTTIDAQCSGGLRAIEIANAMLKDTTYAIAGGLESCSLAPLKQYHKLDTRFTDSPYLQAEFSPENLSLFTAAENVAKQYAVSKLEMQEWMFASQQNAKKASENLKKYILNVDNKSTDQLLKPDLSLKDWQKLETVNIIDRTTAARATDAAAVILLSSNSQNAIAEITQTYTIGSDPNYAPAGPIKAVEAMMVHHKLDISSIDIFEIGDSFAVNALAFAKHFKISTSKINPSGGTLVYGHPYGATGAICLIHLFANLSTSQTGLAIVPGAGGQTTAIKIKKI